MSKWKIIEYGDAQSKEWPIAVCNSCDEDITAESLLDLPFDCPNCGASNLFIQDIDGSFI